MVKGHKEGIQIMVSKSEIISEESLQHFHEPFRKGFRGRPIYKSQKGSIFAYSYEINNESKLANFVFRHWSYGKFYVKGMSAGKTKTHRKWVTLAIIEIIETEGELGYKYYFDLPLSKKNRKINRCKRYWFWKGD